MRLSVTTAELSKLAASRGWVIAIGRLLVAAVLLALLLRFVDVTKLVRADPGYTGAAVAVGVALILLQTALCTARWRLLVKAPAEPPRFWPSFWAYLEGAFLNQVFPSTAAGDAARIIRWRGDGMNTGSAFGSVFMDRLSGAAGAAILAAFGGWLLAQHGVASYLTVPILTLSLSAIALTLAFIWFARSRRAKSIRIFGHAYRVLDQLRNGLVTNRRFFGSLVYSVLGHSISGLAVYCVALSLSVDVPMLLLISITSIVILVSMIPITFAGWGLREASFLTLLVPFNVSSEDAVLIGILFGLICLVAALPGGLSLICDWGRGRQPRAPDCTIAGETEAKAGRRGVKLPLLRMKATPRA